MVFAHFDQLAVAGETTASVAGVGTVDDVVLDDDDVGGAACVGLVGVLVGLFIRKQLLSVFVIFEHHVHAQESGGESLAYLVLLVEGTTLQLFDEVLLHENGHLATTVSVEHSENVGVGVDV